MFDIINSYIPILIKPDQQLLNTINKSNMYLKHILLDAFNYIDT